MTTASPQAPSHSDRGPVVATPSVRRAWAAPMAMLGSRGAPRLAHLASLAAAGAALLWIDRNQWFFFDEWDFITGAAGGAHGNVFEPHNEHWSTVPVIIFRILFRLVGLHSYLPYIAVLVASHLALAHLAWRCMARIGCDAWVATCVVAAFLVLGAGAENLTWAFQIGFVGAVALGLAALLVADRDGGFGSRDVTVWALLVLSLMCSGIGITMTLAVVVFCWLRRGLATAIATASVPAGVFLAWYVVDGRGGLATSPPTRTELLRVPDFGWHGLTGTADAVLGLTGIGALLISALAVFLVARARAARGPQGMAHALALAAAFFFMLTGVGRIHLGLDEALSGRYEYVAAALLMVPTTLALTALARVDVPVRLSVVAVVLYAGAHSGALLVAQAGGAATTKQTDRARVLAAAQLITSGAPIIADPDARPDRPLAPQLSLGTIRRLIADGDLSDLASHPSASALLEARSALQVSLTAEARLRSAPDRVRIVKLTQATRDPGQAPAGCVALTSTGPDSRVQLHWEPPASIGVSSSEGGQVTLWYASADAPADVATPATAQLAPAGQLFVNVVGADAEPTLSLPAGGDVICGAA